MCGLSFSCCLPPRYTHTKPTDAILLHRPKDYRQKAYYEGTRDDGWGGPTRREDASAVGCWLCGGVARMYFLKIHNYCTIINPYWTCGPTLYTHNAHLKNQHEWAIIQETSIWIPPPQASRNPGRGVLALSQAGCYMFERQTANGHEHPDTLWGARGIGTDRQ